MNYRKLTVIVLAAVAYAACSEPEGEYTPPSTPVGSATRVVLLREGTADGTVYVFRRSGERFLYDTLFRAGWNPAGQLSVRMRGGDYRFLFASGEGDNLSFTPSPPTPSTTWEEAAFALQSTGASADELFLQFPVIDAEKVYQIGGRDVTVEARLTRAVSRIGITLKRGYREGDGYVEVPYAAPHSVLDAVERVLVTVTGVAQRVRPAGYEGSARIEASLATADYAELTPEGFARLDGPFILPAADGGPVGLRLEIVPAAGSPLQPAVVELEGLAEQNKRLDITLWITAGYPEIGVDIRILPIGSEQDGDQGIWE